MYICSKLSNRETYFKTLISNLIQNMNINSNVAYRNFSNNNKLEVRETILAAKKEHLNTPRYFERAPFI